MLHSPKGPASEILRPTSPNQTPTPMSTFSTTPKPPGLSAPAPPSTTTSSPAPPGPPTVPPIHQSTASSSTKHPQTPPKSRLYAPARRLRNIRIASQDGDPRCFQHEHDDGRKLLALRGHHGCVRRAGSPRRHRRRRLSEAALAAVPTSPCTTPSMISYNHAQTPRNLAADVATLLEAEGGGHVLHDAAGRAPHVS